MIICARNETLLRIFIYGIDKTRWRRSFCRARHRARRPVTPTVRSLLKYTTDNNRTWTASIFATVKIVLHRLLIFAVYPARNPKMRSAIIAYCRAHCVPGHRKKKKKNYFITRFPVKYSRCSVQLSCCFLYIYICFFYARGRVPATTSVQYVPYNNDIVIVSLPLSGLVFWRSRFAEIGKLLPIIRIISV